MIEDFKRLGKGSLIYGLGNAINQLFGVLVLPLFTRYLTPEEYGIISYFALISLILSSIFTLGLGTSIGVMYFDYSEKEKRNELIFNAFVLMLISTSILAIAGYFGSEYFSVLLLKSSSYNYLFRLNIFLTVFSLLVNPFMFKLQFEEKQFQYITVTILSTIINLSLAVLFVVVWRQGAEGRIESNLIANLIIFGMWFYVGIKGIKIKFNLTILKNILKNGIYMVPAVLCLYLIDKGGAFFLERFFSMELVGIYSLGCVIGSGIALITGSFGIAWGPFFMSYSNRKEEASILFGKIATYFIYVIGGVVILIFIFAKALTFIFSTPNYYEAYKIVGLILLSYFIISMVSFLYPSIYMAKKTILIMYTQLISTIIFILISLLLVPMFGMIGTVTTTLITDIILIIITILFVKFAIKEPLQISFEYKRIIIYFSFMIVSIVIILQDLISDVAINTTVNFVVFGIIITTIIIHSAKYDLKKSNRNDKLFQLIKGYINSFRHKSISL